MPKLSKGDLTKKEIAASFKKLMEKKSFESITVNDITEACGLNRLTFYYHFEDKYALLNWIYYNEIMLDFMNHMEELSWDKNLTRTLRRIESDKAYYQNAVEYDNREFRRYIYNVMLEMYESLLEEWVRDESIDTSSVEFVSGFLAHGTVGMIIDWIEDDLRGTPEELVGKLRELSDEISLMLIRSTMKKVFENSDESDSFAILDSAVEEE